LKKSLIIFDLDGTLIDSVPDLTLGINCMLAQLGRDPFSEDEVRNWVGNGAQILVKRALSGDREIKDIDEGLFQTALNLFMECYEKSLCKKTKVYEGVVETLEILQNRYKLAIVTNKPSRFTKPLLRELDLDRFFTTVVGGDDLDVKKPHPKPLLYCCEQCKVEPKDALMVGDSKNDILSAKSAKIDTIAVSYGYNYDIPISEFEPDIVVDRFSDIKNYLEI